MIAESQRQQIRRFLSDPSWGTIEQVAHELIAQIEQNSKVRDTEWETLKTLLFEEGQCQGIRRFLQTLWEQAGK